MADGRRHSVDIPISRTLIALRRVRSLKDPSTNSMSKFSALLDNVKWEANSTTGISLQFENGGLGGGSDHNGLLSSRNSGLDLKRDKQGDDFELHYGVEKSNSKLIAYEKLRRAENIDSPIKIERLDGLHYYGFNDEQVNGNRASSERSHGNLKDKGPELTCMTPSNNPMEDRDSCSGPIVGSSPVERVDHFASKPKYRCKNQLKLRGAVGDVASRVGSPCTSINDSLSNRSASLFVSDSVDIVGQNHLGCGISYCWSRTPKFRESNPSDVEDHPLLGGDLDDTTFCRPGCWKRINNDITPYSESPRSLSQKFKPKYFVELVGQNIVVTSLLSAVSRGKITSLYLFHGPRGTGKTSASRIFAAALNCLSLAEHKPCGLCRECLLFYSGRSRDVKEVDSVRINRTDRLRSLIKNAVNPPVSSRFKIFIIDECQLLRGETWANILSSLDNFSQHVVFIMITPDLDKLPRNAVSRSQRYHFPKIKDADISNRLGKICVEEGLDFDQVALDFIAAKSNGSLRDAEMMLDQLSLLGKRVTISLAYELIGVVSDDELLALLDLALSSDTSNTVIRARELMRSKIDPMQLISQLANLIMDVLAGRCEEGSSEARRKFCARHTSEEELQKLSHALKILSDTEKHLRVSKNQTTWLTVALLQLSSAESSSLDTNNSKLCSSSVHEKDVDFRNTSSEGDKYLATCSCDVNKPQKMGVDEDCKGTLDSIWKGVMELCQSDSFKRFLQKRGKLSSLHLNQGVAVAELEFHHAKYVSQAEKSWKVIANSLQIILGCNVEIQINLAPYAPGIKDAKVSKPFFGLFSCSRRMQKSQLTTEPGSDSNHSDYTSEKPMTIGQPMLTYSSTCGSQVPPNSNCYQGIEMISALRNSEGNVLTSSSRRSFQDDRLKTPRNHPQERPGNDQEPENQPNCFPMTLRLQKKFRSSDASQMICTSDQQENKLVFSVPKDISSEPYNCSEDPYISQGSSENFATSCDGMREGADMLCWRTPTFPLKRAWQLTHQRRRTRIVSWVLPCNSVK